MVGGPPLAFAETIIISPEVKQSDLILTPGLDSSEVIGGRPESTVILNKDGSMRVYYNQAKTEYVDFGTIFNGLSAPEQKDNSLIWTEKTFVLKNSVVPEGSKTEIEILEPWPKNRIDITFSSNLSDKRIAESLSKAFIRTADRQTIAVETDVKAGLITYSWIMPDKAQYPMIFDPTVVLNDSTKIGDGICESTYPSEHHFGIGAGVFHNSSSGAESIGFIKPDLTSIPASSTITGVTIRLYCTSINAGGENIGFYPVKKDFGAANSFSYPATTGQVSWQSAKQNQVAWDSAGAIGNSDVGTLTVTKAVSSASQWYEINSTDTSGLIQVFQGMLNGTYYGLKTRAQDRDSIDAEVFFAGAENANPSLRPIITIHYSETNESSETTGAISLEDATGIVQALNLLRSEQLNFNKYAALLLSLITVIVLGVGFKIMVYK